MHTPKPARSPVGTTGHVTIVNSNVKPSNNKSIVKTDGGDGDEYTLYLTASGDSTSSTVTTATPADIVLVMDKSGSMNKKQPRRQCAESGQGSRQETADYREFN